MCWNSKVAQIICKTSLINNTYFLQKGEGGAMAILNVPPETELNITIHLFFLFFFFFFIYTFEDVVPE